MLSPGCSLQCTSCWPACALSPPRAERPNRASHCPDQPTAKAAPPSGQARLKNGRQPSEDRPPIGARTSSLVLRGASSFSTGAKLCAEFFSPTEWWTTTFASARPFSSTAKGRTFSKMGVSCVPPFSKCSTHSMAGKLSVLGDITAHAQPGCRIGASERALGAAGLRYRALALQLPRRQQLRRGASAVSEGEGECGRLAGQMLRRPVPPQLKLAACGRGCGRFEQEDRRKQNDEPDRLSCEPSGSNRVHGL